MAQSNKFLNFTCRSGEIFVRRCLHKSTGPANYSSALKSKLRKDVNLSLSNNKIKIVVNDKVAKTPMGNDLVFPVEKKVLAYLVLKDIINMKFPLKTHEVSMISISYRALDGLSDEKIRSAAIESISNFGRTDSVCFFREFPEDLVKLQNEVWVPLINWANEKLKTDIKIFREITSNSKQTGEVVNIFENHLKTLDIFQLAAFEHYARESKSFIIPLALLDKRITVDEAAWASLLESIFQEGRWKTVKGFHDFNFERSRLLASCSLSAYN